MQQRQQDTNITNSPNCAADDTPVIWRTAGDKDQCWDAVRRH